MPVPLQFTLVNIGYAQLDHRWNYDNVISPFSRLYYIKKGSATVYHNDQTFALEEGKLYLIPSYTYSRYQCADYHEQIYIHFLEETAEGFSAYDRYQFRYEVLAKAFDVLVMEQLMALHPSRSIIKDDPEVYDNTPSLLNFLNKNQSGSLSHQMNTQALLHYLFSRFLIARKSVHSPQRTEIDRTVRHIQEHLHQPLTVQNLAELNHQHPDYFSRIFKANHGVRPSTYIQNKRIERAQLLLTTTHDSLKSIAHKVGLGTVSYFARSFRKHTGMTPTAYRKQHWNI